MIVGHFELEHPVSVIYGEWDEARGGTEAAVTVQRDASATTIVVRQREHELVIDSSMARELAKVLVREAKAAEAAA